MSKEMELKDEIINWIKSKNANGEVEMDGHFENMVFLDKKRNLALAVGLDTEYSEINYYDLMAIEEYKNLIKNTKKKIKEWFKQHPEEERYTVDESGLKGRGFFIAFENEKFGLHWKEVNI